jgi:hypothetical protein
MKDGIGDVVETAAAVVAVTFVPRHRYTHAM